MKNHYNKHHISLLLNLKNLVILKLHHKYYIFDIKNKKFFIQQVDCFFIKQQILLLAYKLKLSVNMKIYSVMSVIIFEFVLLEINFYNYLYNDNSLFMK